MPTGKLTFSRFLLEDMPLFDTIANP